MRRDSDAHRQAIEALCIEYAAALDDGRLEEWPDFFTTDGLYQVISRENFDRGLPVAFMRCESRGMLLDRVAALRRTAVFAPRVVRHLVSGLRVLGEEGGVYRAESNYAIFESRLGEQSKVLSVGRYLDRVVREGDVYRFKERRCVVDGELIPSSLVYPI